MADLDQAPLERPPHRHDGLAACRLCSSVDAAAQHDWCPAREALVCDACCRRLLAGDVSRADPLVGDPDPLEAFDTLITTCIACERGRRWYAEQIQNHFGSGPEPC